MGRSALKSSVPVEEYLHMLEGSPERLMYWDGEVFAMTGDTLAHDTVQRNVVGHLGLCLQGMPCRPFTGSRRLRQASSDRCIFADALVVCGRSAPHPDDKEVTTNPTVVFEVLSPSTEAFDRGDKFAYYRSFPSIQSVVFLSQKEVLVEYFRRSADDVWMLQILGAGQQLEIPSAGCVMPVSALYEGVEFEG